MNTTEEKVTARAYELPEGGWEVNYSDMPMDTPQHVQEDDFPFFLGCIREGNEGIVEIIVYPWCVSADNDDPTSCTHS